MELPNMSSSMHAYPQPLPLPAMTAFAQAPMSQSAQQQSETDRARAYKSRNKRPCDFCRLVETPHQGAMLANAGNDQGIK